MTYEEAASEMRRLVDQGLMKGLRQQEQLPKSELYDLGCDEPDHIYPAYDYHFPLDLVGPDPDSFVVRVENYWKSEGFQLDQVDADPGINDTYATSPSGFNLHVFVNRNTGMALVEGSGPCVQTPQ